jgi:hypothetical protein
MLSICPGAHVHEIPARVIPAPSPPSARLRPAPGEILAGIRDLIDPGIGDLVLPALQLCLIGARRAHELASGLRRANLGCRHPEAGTRPDSAEVADSGVMFSARFGNHSGRRVPGGSDDRRICGFRARCPRRFRSRLDWNGRLWEW